MPQCIAFSWHILQYKQFSTLQWFCGYYSFVAKPAAILCSLPLATYLQSAAAGNWSWQLKKRRLAKILVQDFSELSAGSGEKKEEQYSVVS